jgi:peptide/nickel transport system permease protein
MGIYLIRRVAWGVLVLLGVSLITFFIAFEVPVDPARNIGGIHATRAALANIRQTYGLDQPVPIQYLRYLGRVSHGDLGRAYSVSEDVLPAIRDRLPYTGVLALCGILFELAIGVPLGLVAAVRPGHLMDRGTLLITLVVFSLPPFVLGNLLLLVFAFDWSVFPLGGADAAGSIFLPALTLACGGAVWYTRLLRTTLLDVLRADYVRTARAKGLSRGRVLVRHAVPNAIGPVITQVGLDMSYFLGGVVVVESVFAWPGVGKLAYDAISHDDINLIMGTVLVGAVFVVLVNILVDVAQAWLDPRIRLS